MKPVEGSADVPGPFRRAVGGLAAAKARPEIELEEIPAPQRLAPYSAALAARLRRGDAELASARFVLLHDPDSQPGWNGTFRVVVYVRADLEPEIFADALLPSVGWSWLTEALDAHDAEQVAMNGSVTRVASESFGGMADEPATSEVELRASWTPVGEDMTPHVEAWCDVLASAAGLPPAPPGVASFPPQPPQPDARQAP